MFLELAITKYLVFIYKQNLDMEFRLNVSEALLGEAKKRFDLLMTNYGIFMHCILIRYRDDKE